MANCYCWKCKKEFYYDYELGINVYKKELKGKVLYHFDVWPYCPSCEVICAANNKNEIDILVETPGKAETPEGKAVIKFMGTKGNNTK